MIRYLLDTSALAAVLHPSPAPEFLHHFREHQATCAISSVAWHELAFGVARLPSGRRKEHLERFLFEAVAGLPILPYDTAAAALHAGERVVVANMVAIHQHGCKVRLNACCKGHTDVPHEGGGDIEVSQLLLHLVV